MMPRDTADTAEVVAFIGGGPLWVCEHIRSQSPVGVKYVFTPVLTHLYQQTRPTTHVPHVPYTTTYALEVQGRSLH